ncbi:hypothetical protein C2G38_2037533 [Gigaspora rosea]|uniref:C17orf113 probable zinc finger domain-containing protein n=1 Tax=Gigaspora rosea TaxID=44941 RepID=A0A397V7R4_9GLOM|nr:hypothetical protein C2G38_2037533 [Gigaspora rosea]
MSKKLQKQIKTKLEKLSQLLEQITEAQIINSNDPDTKNYHFFFYKILDGRGKKKNAKKRETNILTNEKSASSSTTSLDNIISLDGDQVISSSENNSDNAFSSDYNYKKPKPKFAQLTKENLKWNPTWEITYPWLRLDEKKEKPVLFCKLCESAKLNNNFVMGCEYLKEQSIKRHIKTKDHQKLIKTRDKLQISLEIGFTNQLGTSHLSVIQNLVNTY